MSQPSSGQVRSVFGRFKPVIDMGENVTVENVRSVFGRFSSVIDSTDIDVVGTPRSFGTIY